MSHEISNKLIVFGKPTKAKIKILTIVFLWIALCNVVYQYLHAADLLHFEIGSLHLGVENWAFFAAVTLFFLQEELSYKNRFWHTLVGGTVGLLLAAALVVITGALQGQGLDHATAICIPLMVILAVLIIASPFAPMIFNNVGFIYFIVALIKSGELIHNLPSYIFSLVLGSLILNLGCSVLINAATKAMQKKAAAKAKETQKVS